MLNFAVISTRIERAIPGNHPRSIAMRQYLEATCIDFASSGLADPKYVSELSGGSEQKFWASVSEALIADRLRGKCFGTRKTIGEGPDFLVMSGTRKVWIEVVCPEPIRIPTDWLVPPSGEAVTFPHEAILLRWTSAIRAKAERLVGSEEGTRKSYLNAGLVAPEDAYVIAVNGCRLRSGPWPALFGISQLPFAVEAVFPVGPIQVKINEETLKMIDCGHQHRPFVINQNGAEVAALTFVDPRFSAVSAIWAVDFNGGSAIGNSEPSVVVHNPSAANPVPLGFLPTETEYVAVQKGGELILTNASVPLAPTMRSHF